MRRLVLLFTICASPALAQSPEGQLPSEAACKALKDRVQIALAQADRGLKDENPEMVTTWSTIAANYSQVHSAFCPQPDE